MQELIRYDETENQMERAGQAANVAASLNAWEQYHIEISPNTHLRQMNDLASYCAYLAQVGIERTAEQLYTDAWAWAGTTYGLLAGYVQWALQQGYAVGTINVRLATMRKYCDLCGPHGAGSLDLETLALIKTVKGVAGKKAHNQDRVRAEQGIETRRGHKKADPTHITTNQALLLKKPAKQARGTQLRDAALMGLFIEHAFRCGEIAGLRIEHINLQEGTITFYREKTNRTETHRIQAQTYRSLESYLREEQRTMGPLFLGNQGKALSQRAINARVGVLGKQAGVDALSPHDLRHYWAFDALRNKTPFDRVKSGGGWKSDSMVLRYAQRAGIANEGVIISTEED